MRDLRKRQNAHLQNKLIFLGTLVFECFLFNLFKSAQFSGSAYPPRGMATWCVSASWASAITRYFGKCRPQAFTLLQIVNPFQGVGKRFAFASVLTCLNGFPILIITLFLSERLNFWCGNIHPHKNENLIHFKREWLLIIDEGTTFYVGLKTTKGHTWISFLPFSPPPTFFWCCFLMPVQLDFWYYKVAKLHGWKILKNNTT